MERVIVTISGKVLGPPCGKISQKNFARDRVPFVPDSQQYMSADDLRAC
jgi:hypothetical protein